MVKLTNLEDQMDKTEESVISTKCITGHKFKVPKEKIQASSSGKSFVTLCPKCNKVARLRKEEVFQLFGINPRDHVAVGNLFASLTNQSTQPVVSGVPTNGASFQDTVSAGGAKFQKSKPIVEEDEIDDEDDLDDEEDDDEDQEDEEDEDDKEYTAQVETAPDVTGKKKTVQRFRTVSDEEDDEADDEEDERERTPVKAKKPAKKTRTRRVRDVVSSDEEEDEEDEEPEDRRSRKTARKSIDEDEPMDPNDILKDVIDESGIDDVSRDHIFDYIDLQPDGWQPSAIQGVIEMYVSPASARKISQRYQAELYREQKRREREQRLLNMMGAPSGNIRLDDNRGMGVPPFNNPVGRGNPPIGAPFMNAPRMDQYGRDQYGNDPYGDGQYRDPRAYNDPRMVPVSVPMRQAPSVSPMQVKQMITEEMTTQFEKLQNALTQTKREDALQNEIAQMRALMFDVIKSKATEQNAPPQQKQTDPLLASLLTNQSDLNKTLLMNTLDKSNKEDPMQKILLQELMELKKVRSAPPLTHTTEELTQRIQLQKLANDLELAQAEFRDKAEGRVFARDLAGQALTKIGESFATAYLESQRTAAMQAAQSQSMGLTPPPVAQIVPPEPVVAESAQKSAPQIDASAQPRVSTSQLDEREAEKYHVKGVTQEDGSITIPCPTCGSDIIARPGDTRVVCNMCGSAFTAGSPQQHEYATGETQEAEPQTQEAPSKYQGSTQEVEEPPRKMPKGIL